MTWEGRGIFEVSSADPDSTTPVWVDLTVYVNDEVVRPTLGTGRQNDLDQSEPSRLELVLNNADDRFTYGNTASPYAAWWGPGRKCRYREIIAGTTVELFVGYLQIPTEGLITAGVEQRVAITAVDRLGRLESDEPFVSTLAEHIKYVGGSSLKAYYPMNEPSGQTFRSAIPSAFSPLGIDKATLGIVGGPAVTFNSPTFRPSDGPSANADDIQSLRFIPNLDANGLSVQYSFVSADGSLPQASGETFVVAMWFTYVENAGGGSIPSIVFAGGSNALLLQHNRPSSPGGWEVSANGSGGGVSAATDNPPQRAPMLVALRLTLPSGLVEFWRGTDPPVTASLPAPPASGTWTHVRLPEGMQGTIGHLQLYVGAGAYSREQHLAQYQMGLTGMERQTTGDRIRTVLAYAGVPASELTQIDKGTSIMQAASLAGQTPLQPARDAERTEQGLLYVDGAGNVVFKDRRTLYNI